ncbi:MAG: ribonuclease H-like domain-containing protein [Candidatus Paceibacterota bacterium]|jgi:hypothetical protein
MNKNSTLVFDIETVGEDFDQMDETTQEVLTSWIRKTSADDEEYKVKLAELKDGMGFSPLTGQVIAIAMLDYEKNKSAVYFQAPGEQYGEFEENGAKFKQMDEAEMLSAFWNVSKLYSNFVTFNGRGFDVPFLNIRSAVHKIRPSKNLMSNRYLTSQDYEAKHIDLYDQLSYYGASRGKGSLHLYTRAFGIESPKDGGIKGEDVAEFFKNNKYLEIAKYNVRDIKATGELYKIWKDLVAF